MDENVPNVSEIENTGLQYCVYIDVMLPEYTLRQYSNMEYNNDFHSALMNGNMSTSNNSPVSALTPVSVTSRNDKVFSLQNPIHENIKYSHLSKTQERAVHCATDVIKTQIKLLANKTWHSTMLENFLKDKSTKEVLSEMDIITTLPTQ